MAIRPTGLVNIALGTWELHKAKKAFNDGLISGEVTTSRQRFNKTKIGIGALKLVLIGYSASEIITPILKSNNFSNIDLSLLATFAAGYAVLSFADINSSILSSEAVNYKYNQSNLEKNIKIRTESNSFEMNAGDAYQLYMLGNKLTTSNPFDNFIFKIREEINNWKINFKIDDNKEFGIIKKNIYKFLKKTGIESIFDNIHSSASIKSEVYKTIKEFSDLKGENNKEFISYIKKEHKEISLNDEDIKLKLREVNQEAILKTYQNTLVQNLQLFFSQVVVNYNNGIVDKKILEKFEKLNEQNTIKSENIVLFKEYEKISKISKMMLNNEDLSKRFKSNCDVLKHLENKALENGKVKFLNFNEMFKLERKAIINNKNGLNKANHNIYEDKKANFSELSFENNLISQFTVKKENKKNFMSKSNSNSTID